MDTNSTYECGDPAESSRLPLTAGSVKTITKELLLLKPYWYRKDLAKEAERVYCERGGMRSASYDSLLCSVKNCLKKMGKNGEAVNLVPSAGIWCAIEKYPECSKFHNRASATAPVPSRSTARNNPSIQTLKCIGSGSESVYVYFFPAYKELAILKGYLSWPCKIGRTESVAADRILGQGSTSYSEYPIIGLEIKTDRSVRIERTIQHELANLGLKIKDSPGSEWFTTSPDAVEKWYQGFIELSKFLL